MTQSARFPPASCQLKRVNDGWHFDCSPPGHFDMAEPNRTILLIEDDLSLSASLCQFLADHGYRTIAAPTARRGWELIQTQSPRLCLLDLNLPDGSGFDILRRIARMHLAVQVIVMTAFDLAPLRSQSLNAKPVAWLTKPINPLELLRIVERTLGEQSLAPASAP
jgi:DNA-binding response OmpR family regulator